MNRYAIVMLLTYGRAPLVIIASLLTLLNLFHPSVLCLIGAVLLLSISALTDLFDGFFARKWNVTSRLGALADPLMDKVFYAVALPVATFVALYNEHINHAFVLLALDVISMLRDQWVSFLRSVGSEYGADVRANWSGKLRTLIGFPVIVIIHLQLGLETLRLHHDAYEGISVLPPAFIYAIEGALIAVTLLSAGSYTLRYLPSLRQAAKHDSSS